MRKLFCRFFGHRWPDRTAGWVSYGLSDDDKCARCGLRVSEVETI